MHCGFHVLLVLLALQCYSLSAIAVAPSRAKLQALLNEGEQGELSHNLRQAEVNYLGALKEAEKFGPRSAEIQECEARLAAVYVLQGRLQQAEPHYLTAKSIAVDLRKDGKDHPESLVWLDDLSDAYQLKGNSTQPEFCYLRCLELRKAISPRHKNLANVETLYGAQLMMTGRIPEGEKHLKHAHLLRVELNGVDHKDTANTSLVMANAYGSIGRFTEAEKYCAEASAIIEKRVGDSNTLLANIKRLHSNYLTKLGRNQEAKKEINDVLKIHKKYDGENSVEYAYDLASLASTELSLHNLADADSASKRSLSIFEKHPNAITLYRIEALRVGAKVARLQHRNASAASLEAELKNLEGKH